MSNISNYSYKMFGYLWEPIGKVKQNLKISRPAISVMFLESQVIVVIKCFVIGIKVYV